MLSFRTCEKDHFVAQWDKVDMSIPVTLIGDCAHPVPLFGALGVQMAFQDVAALYEALTTSDNNLVELSEYRLGMVERAKAGIERSTMRAVRFFGMKPLHELKAM